MWHNKAITKPQQSRNKATTKPQQCHMCQAKNPMRGLRHALERLPQVISVEDWETLILGAACLLASPR
jgi:hypothetical protein